MSLMTLNESPLQRQVEESLHQAIIEMRTDERIIRWDGDSLVLVLRDLSAAEETKRLRLRTWREDLFRFLLGRHEFLELYREYEGDNMSMSKSHSQSQGRPAKNSS